MPLLASQQKRFLFMITGSTVSALVESATSRPISPSRMVSALLNRPLYPLRLNQNFSSEVECSGIPRILCKLILRFDRQQVQFVVEVPLYLPQARTLEYRNRCRSPSRLCLYHKLCCL